MPVRITGNAQQRFDLGNCQQSIIQIKVKIWKIYSVWSLQTSSSSACANMTFLRQPWKVGEILASGPHSIIVTFVSRSKLGPNEHLQIVRYSVNGSN